jgi:hypothetical protein
MRCLLLLLPFLALWAPTAEAAPFCLQIAGVAPQCVFHDVSSCTRQALRMNAVCGINPKELMAPTVGQRFCQVENGPVFQCLYADRRSCEAVTARTGGICIDAGDALSRPDPDLIPR